MLMTFYTVSVTYHWLRKALEVGDAAERLSSCLKVVARWSPYPVMAGPLSATVRAATRRRLIPQRVALVLTQAAVKKVRTIMDSRPDMIGLKVGVRTRGCNGLSYTIEYAKEKNKQDEVVVQDGVTVLIDKKAQLTLLGTEMDYQESKLASEFVFHNPNIKGTCGCGESFSL